MKQVNEIIKNSILFCGLLALPFLSFGQSESSEKNLQLGFTVSPNLGWMRFNNEGAQSLESDGSAVGVSYGILADAGFAKNYYFSTGFVLTSIVSKSKIEAGATLSDYKYKISYVEIPFTLKLKSNLSDLGRFYGQFGLGTGVKVSAKQDYRQQQGGVQTVNDEDKNIGSDTNIFRLSLIAGGGAEWNIGRNLSLLTGVTFNNGFTKVLDGNSDSRNSYVAFNLGMFF